MRLNNKVLFSDQYPSAALQHLPWEGRKYLHIIKIHLLPEISPPDRGSARRTRGFIWLFSIFIKIIIQDD
jgi:hypothetical protein